MVTNSRTTRRIAFVIAALATMATSRPAAAIEFFGITLFEQNENEPDVVDPHRYSVEFRIEGFDDDTADAKKLRLASELFTRSGRPTSGSAGLVRMAHEDYSRVLGALFDQGRYGGSISILLSGREAAEVSPIDTLPEPTQVVIRVDPGVAFRFGEVRIIPQAEQVSKADGGVALPSDEGFQTGELAFANRIRDAQDLAVDAWRKQGHALAQVADARIIADHGTSLVDASILLAPGPKLRFADVQISGSQKIDHDFLVYMADLPKGAVFDPDKIEEAKERFARLGVFRSVVVNEEQAQIEDGEIPISIVVNDRKPRRISFGVSASSVDGIGVEASWLHRNLFGRAEQLRFDGRISSINDVYLSEGVDYLISAGMTFPGILNPNSDFNMKLAAERAEFDTYEEESLTATAGFSQVFSPLLAGEAGVVFSFAEFTDDLGVRTFQTLGLEGALTYDGRDTKTDATQGYYARVEVRPTYELEFSNLGIRGTVEGRAYRSFMDDDKLVLAGRLKLGVFLGSTVDETAPDNLFFTGGGNSVRGYPFNSIGVTLPGGSVVGGSTLIEGSMELRARFTERIGGAAFVDFGIVNSGSAFDLGQNAFVGVGAGVRYYTTLGPVRFDVAIPQQRRSGDPDYVFYIGIGQAF